MSSLSNVHARLIDLPTHADSRGMLAVAQFGDVVPFTPTRMFALFGIPDGGERGCHAHFEQHQLVTMPSGSCRIRVRTGSTSFYLDLGAMPRALYVPPMTWIELMEFSPGAVCIVLASGEYDETDYIRDFERYLALCVARAA